MNESRNSEIQREHFNKVTERYLAGRAQPNSLAYKEVFWNYIWRELESVSAIKDAPFTSLEAMCGDAPVTSMLTARYPSATCCAFDYSDAMVQRAQKQLPEDVHLWQQDILTWQEESKYDLVFLIGGLHHVPDSVPLALHNIYHALKPGAFFVNVEPTSDFFLWQKARNWIYRKNTLFEESTERGFTLAGYREVLRDAGFVSTTENAFGLLGYILYYNPDAFPLLNMGTPALARLACRLDLFLGRKTIGKKLSFGTLVIAQKPC